MTERRTPIGSTSKLFNQSEQRCVYYPIRDYIAFTQNRTGSYGLPYIYIYIVKRSYPYKLKPRASSSHSWLRNVIKHSNIYLLRTLSDLVMIDCDARFNSGASFITNDLTVQNQYGNGESFLRPLSTYNTYVRTLFFFVIVFSPSYTELRQR